MHSRLLASAVLLVALAGCSSPAPVPTLTPAPTVAAPDDSAETTLVADLMPRTGDVVTAAEAQAEAIRLVDAVQALVEPASIVSTDQKAELVPADDDIPAYYGVARALFLDPTVDARQLAQALAAILAQSGWTQSQATDEGGIYQAILTGGSPSAPWVIFVEGNTSTEGQSTATITLGSPDVVE